MTSPTNIVLATPRWGQTIVLLLVIWIRIRCNADTEPDTDPNPRSKYKLFCDFYSIIFERKIFKFKDEKFLNLKRKKLFLKFEILALFRRNLGYLNTEEGSTSSMPIRIQKVYHNADPDLQHCFLLCCELLFLLVYPFYIIPLSLIIKLLCLNIFLPEADRFIKHHLV